MTAVETAAAFVIAEPVEDGREWYRPTAHCRGPWDPSACHAGPPTGLLARAAERLLPDQQLVRLTVELTRPVPFAGFTIDASVARAGRTVSTSELAIVDGDGRTVASARAMHLTLTNPGDVPSATYPAPPLDEAGPGPFPLNRGVHGLPMFAGGVEVRYPPGEDAAPGPTRLWMRTVPLVLGEEPTPFQRLCPLADCGNGISRNDEAGDLTFLNTDLTIVVHRLPVDEWIGIDCVSRWEPSGVGMADSLLFDTRGAVGRAVQTLVVQRR